MTDLIQPFVIEPGIQKPDIIKQVIESCGHPLNMIREVLSNIATPEVASSDILVQHYSDPVWGATFRFKDDGRGMEYTGDDENPGRLDRFIGFGFSKAAALKADLYGWKGLGAKLMLNCRRLEILTWTGSSESDVFHLEVIEPRGHLLQYAPVMPRFYLKKRPPETYDSRGTLIYVFGYDGGLKEYSFEEIKRFLYLNTVVGLTDPRAGLPSIRLRVGNYMEELPVGYEWIAAQYDERGQKSWHTVALDPPVSVTEKSCAGEEVTVVLKGGFTLDTDLFKLSPHTRNTGLRLSIKGVPHFPLDFYAYTGSKFQQCEDLCSFVVECDAIEPNLNMDRSNICNEFGDDTVLGAFRKAVSKAFDIVAESEDYRVFLDRRTEDQESKATFLIRTQEELSSADSTFVCVNDPYNGFRIVHRVPGNEQDTLALFWKLEGLSLLPFERFTSLGYIGKEGIDVIATFQASEDSHLWIMEPVKFEVAYENFLPYRLNPEQTSLVMCWAVEHPENLQQINPYSYQTRIGNSMLTVYEIRNFPKIEIKKYSEVDF